MAIQERYVNPSLASSDGTGTRATISLSAATFTFSTLNLNETNAFSGYTFVTGDEIFLSGGTNVTTGFHTIASRTDASNIVMAADITSDSSDPTDVTADSKPYGDLQFGLDTADHPASGGGRINIKAGSDEILGAALDLDTSGTGYLQSNATSTSNYLIFQGYTTSSDDGGIGGVSGNGSVSIIISTTQDNIIFRDMHLHNVGARQIIQLDNFIQFINCEIDSGNDAIDMDLNCVVVGCYIHDFNGKGLQLGGNCVVKRTRVIDDSTGSGATFGIRCLGSVEISECQVWLDTVGADGIEYDVACSVDLCSVFQNAAGTGKGIAHRGTGTAILLTNNLVEGFDGAGGVGIENGSTGFTVGNFGNYVSDCTNSYVNADKALVVFDNEDVADTTPFTDGANKDFSPVNTGNIKEGSQPSKIGLFTVP